MSTVNGIGTAYIGQADVRPDGSYIRTNWFCFVFPLIPLGSYRIWPESSKSYALGMYSTSSFKAKPVGMYWPQVFKIYGIYLAFYIFLIIAERVSSGQWNFS